MNEQFLTLKEVAEILRVSVIHVQNLIHQGKLRGYKFGNERAMRVQVVDLQQFIGGCGVVDTELMKKGSIFHMKVLETMVEGKMTHEAALEFLKGGDPEGYQAHEYFQRHKYDKSAPDIRNLRFDNPSAPTASGQVAAGNGLDFESAVIQIMERENCRECEAVRLLMQTDEGKKLFERHWAEIEQGARERSHVYFK